ncbi:hypothetical protein DFH11DRAFT_1520191 [Phellopilus nigrolimitatus]|nr:hypothetical protein DFH11DRAFT_1520317 [Phellopilus nigrolimitatus]KAH8104177.1 hypothetical protein DFH11DRAFT_1520191 [Phellopilus nigrolimitatus]
MKENQRVATYIVQFQRHAPLTGYNAVSLANEFYRGLPERIKDTISIFGRPRGYDELKRLAIDVDHRYWERESERLRTSRSRGTNTSKPSNANPPSEPATGTNNGTRTTNPPNPAILKEGKLTPEERQRRQTNRLCMVCGDGSHQVETCPHRRAPANRTTNASNNSNSRSATNPANPSNTRTAKATFTVNPQNNEATSSTESATPEASIIEIPAESENS